MEEFWSRHEHKFSPHEIERAVHATGLSKEAIVQALEDMRTESSAKAGNAEVDWADAWTFPIDGHQVTFYDRNPYLITLDGRDYRFNHKEGADNSEYEDVLRRYLPILKASGRGTDYTTVFNVIISQNDGK